MLDKNGKEMGTGDIVMITGSYFAIDNGKWLIARSPGDDGWNYEDYKIRKITPRGKLSTSRYHVNYWPIRRNGRNSFERLSNSCERRLAMIYNRKHAMIEVIGHMEAPKEVYS